MPARKIEGWWYADFYVGKKRYRERSPQNTSSAARAYEQFLLGEIAKTGTLPHLHAKKPIQERPSSTFAEYADEWLAGYVRIKNRSSERQGKASILRRHLKPHFGPFILTAIARREIDLYKAQKLQEGLSAKTINNHLTILRKCLWTAQQDALLPSLPLIEWLEEDPPGFDYLVPRESFQLLQEQSEPFWTDLVRLAVRTGLRRGELMALDWSCIDLEHKRLTVRQSIVRGVLELPKNGRVRHLPLTDDVVAMLAQRRQRRGPVFPRPDGGMLSQTSMRHGLHRLCRRAGLRTIGWHVLRHTFASQLVMEGVPLLTVSRLMGHSSIKMTERYAHLAPSHLAEAVPLLLRAEEREAKVFGQYTGSEAQSAVASSHQTARFQV